MHQIGLPARLHAAQQAGDVAGMQRLGEEACQLQVLARLRLRLDR